MVLLRLCRPRIPYGAIITGRWAWAGAQSYTLISLAVHNCCTVCRVNCSQCYSNMGNTSEARDPNGNVRASSSAVLKLLPVPSRTNLVFGRACCEAGLSMIRWGTACVYHIVNRNRLWGAYSLPSCSNPVKP